MRVGFLLLAAFGVATMAIPASTADELIHAPVDLIGECGDLVGVMCSACVDGHTEDGKFVCDDTEECVVYHLGVCRSSY